jgi:hypothetical protein
VVLQKFGTIWILKCFYFIVVFSFFFFLSLLSYDYFGPTIDSLCIVSHFAPIDSKFHLFMVVCFVTGIEH